MSYANRTPRENSVRGRIAIATRWGNVEELERARAELREIKARKLMEQAHELLRQNDESTAS